MKELEFINTIKVGITDDDLFEWIEDFFSHKRIKPNHSIEISHKLTEELAEHIFKNINRKFKEQE